MKKYLITLLALCAAILPLHAADKTIAEFPELTSAATGDKLLIYDVSASAPRNRFITVGNLSIGLAPTWTSITGKPITITEAGGANLTLATDSTLATLGSYSLTLTATGNTTITLPTTGTLATRAGVEALTNKTVNGLTITSSTGTLTVANGKTVTLSNTLNFTGTDASTIAFGAGGTVAYQGGALGAATATSINGLTLTSTTGTLTIASGKALTASNTLTLTGTDASTVAFGAGGTVAYTANKLSAFAATSSSELAGVISDETGTGALVFGTSPNFATGATIGSVAIPTISSTNTLTNKTINGANNTLTVRLANDVSGLLPLANGGTGVSDPLFQNVRHIQFVGLNAVTGGDGSTNVTYGCSILSIGSSPLTPSDVAEHSMYGVTGQNQGTGTGSFGVPTVTAWRGSMSYIPADASYGLFVGSWSGGATLDQPGYGVRVIDKDTLQLVLYVAGNLYTQNCSVSGFLDNNTGNWNRQCIVLKWNGVDTLSLYASFASPGAAVGEPTLRGSLVQTATGSTFSTHVRWGVYSVGSSSFSNELTLQTFSVVVREN